MFIEKVGFCKLRSDKSDRRGRLAIFWLKEIPNSQYMFDSTALFIRQIINLLNEHYCCLDWSDPQTHESYLFGEAQDCWLNRGGEIKSGEESPVLWINHKYWSNAEIEAFKKIVLALAERYQWEVIDTSSVEVW